MGTGFAAAEDGAVSRFEGDDFEFRLALLDVAGHTGQRAARAYAGDENVGLAVGVLPYLRASGGVVDRRVSRIVELTRAKAVGSRSQNLVGLGDGALHAIRSRRQHELRAKAA